jgi:hypothetical protein
MRGKRSASLFSLAAMLALCLCAPGAFAYNYAKSITVDRSKIPNTCGATLASFPVLFSVTDAALKHTSSGGKVTDTSGDDIIFRGLDTTTCGGPSSCTLDHEIEKYDNTTGQLIAWVRVPALNTSAAGSDTVIYINYADSTVTTPTTNPTGVWDTNYKGVWHLKEGTGVTAADSTSNANSAVPNNGNPTTATGQIGGALTFSGQRLNIAASASLDLTSATSPNWTMSAWVKPTSYTGTSWPAIYSYGSWRASLGLSQAEAGTDGRIENWTNDTTALHSSSAVTLNAWNHVVVTRSAATTTFYWNGSANGSFTTPAAVTTTGQVSGIGSDGNGAYDATEHFIGLIDEVRVSKSVRSACWIQGEYNNQSSPSTFYTVGSETQFLATISSAANQSFSVGQASTTASVITVTDAASNTITTANEIRIRIPATFNMTWDTSVTTITRGGGASAKVSATLKAYEDSNRTAVVDVTTNFAANDVLTITGLKFTSFTAISAADKLQLVVGGAGAATTNLDDKTITIVAAVGGFNAYETSTGAGAITGVIKTKIAGSTVSLDVIALNAAKTAIGTTFTGTVRVEVLDASNNSAGLDGNGCRSSWSVIQTLADPTFVTGDLGRKTISFTQANSYPNARLKIYYPTSSPTAIGCSGDNFAIRPLAFSSVTSNMTNSGTTGAPVTSAGGSFTITAVAIAGYNGTPTIDNTKITAHAGAVQNGSVSGSFGAANPASGTATGAAFTYSEVGNFSIGVNGVYDSTFTAVDPPGTECTNDFSNTLVGGSYGCSFGNSVASAAIGRFRPDHFIVTPGTLTNRQALSCAPASTYTYEGEQLRVTFMLTARNGLGTPATTQNYTTTSGFAKLDGTVYTNFGFGAVDLADATPPLAATALTARVPSGTSSGTWVGGIGSFTVDLAVSRAASPDGPFESLRIGIIPADTDTVTVRAADLNLDTTVPADSNDRVLVGSSKIRFGRLAIRNANGSQLVPLPVPLETQYWNGTAFITNTADNCTSIAAANLALSNYTQNLNACETSLTVGAFASGRATAQLSAPGSANNGNVNLTANLGASGSGTTCIGGSSTAVTGADRAYLQGNWTGGNYDQNPSARATFGVFKGAEEVIFVRENF